jgi:hypothetical protein
MGMPAGRFTLEYYRSPGGDEPVRRWIFDRPSAPRRRAVVMGLQHILAERVLAVCGTELGRHLCQGLFEFRLRYDEAAVRRRLHLVGPRHQVRSDEILCFCGCSVMPTAIASSCFWPATTRAPTRAASASSARSTSPGDAMPTSGDESGRVEGSENAS